MDSKRVRIPWNKGTPRTEEEKKKISERRKQLFQEGKITAPWKGKHLSEETKSKQSETKKQMFKEGKLKAWNKGKHLTNEQKQKLSETRIRMLEEGKIRVWNKGIPWNKETKKKISEINKKMFQEGLRSVSHEQRIEHSLRMKGEGNPRYGKHLTDETKRKITLANKGRFSGEKNPFFGKTHTEETREILRLKSSMHNKLEGNPRWLGGKSFEPYGIEFNRNLKANIRKMYDYTCQICGKTEKELKKTLCIHHIDYDKRDNKIPNLIPLCTSCHSRTNSNRVAWVRHFWLFEEVPIDGFYDDEKIDTTTKT